MNSAQATVCTALVFFPSILLFIPAIDGDFVFDDLPAIKNNPDLNFKEDSNLSSFMVDIFKHDFWGESLTSKNSHKSYRPLTVLTFAIQKFLRHQPAHFHQVNLVIHGSNCILIFFILVKVTKSISGALLASVIFSLHPIHVEPVAGLVGRADLLHSFFTLVAIAMNLSTDPKSFFVTALVITLCIISTFCKELGIMTIPLIICVDILKYKLSLRLNLSKLKKYRVWIKRAIIYLFAVGGLVTFRLWLVNFEPPKFQIGDNPFSFIESNFWRRLNLGYIHALNGYLLISPEWLCFDWAFHCISPISDSMDPRFYLVFVFYSILLAICLTSVSNNDYKSFLFLMLATLPFIPASNVFFRVGFVIAERNLYLSSLGVVCLVLTGYQRLKSRLRRKWQRNTFKFHILIVVLSYSAKTWTRSGDWKNETALFTSGIKVCPDNPKVWYNLAKIAADRASLPHLRSDFVERERTKAIYLYDKALKLWPQYHHALNNLGNLYRQVGRVEEAKNLLQKALLVQPEFPACWMNLGVAQAQLGQLDEAEASYKVSLISEVDCFNRIFYGHHRALSQRRYFPDCHFNMGTLYLKMKKNQEALDQFKIAVHLKDTHFAAWSNLVILLDNLQRYKEAENASLQALRIFPKKSDFYFHLGNIYGKLDKFEEAEAMYLEALKFDEEKSLHFHNLGVLYHRWHHYENAAEAYKRALVLDPKNKSTATNLKTVREMMKTAQE